MESASHVPQDETVTAWCCDITTDLSGSVGTIEIGRERANGLNIQPGYEGNAVYDSARDGQLVPLMAQSPAGQFVNLALLPGTQKWNPMFRNGTITEIDYDLDTCTVSLDLATSSQQGLDINQEIGLYNVPIDYMDCNAVAFAVDDAVVVQFIDYDFADPVVIGFQSHPKPCSCWLESWSGPAITTLYPWAILGPLVYTDDPEAPELPWNVYLVGAGVLTVSIAQTESGYKYYDTQYALRYDLTPAFIRPNCNRVKFKGTGSTYRFAAGYRQTEFALQIRGKNQAAATVYFQIYLVCNYDDFGKPVIGCVDDPTDPETWSLYGSDTWICSVANNFDEYITLPVANINIELIQLYSRIGVASVPPYPDYLNGLSVTVDTIELC